MPNHRFRPQQVLLCAICLIALCRVLRAQNVSDQNHFIAENDVTWTALGKDENDSMPIGNGDIPELKWYLDFTSGKQGDRANWRWNAIYAVGTK